MAINKGTKENHLFWYRSILFLPGIVGEKMNLPAVALNLIDSVTNKFPPITVWEKLQVLSSVAYCYGKVNKPILADRKYKQLLELAIANPHADPYAEMFGDYIEAARYYISQNRISTALQFLKLAKVRERANTDVVAAKYLLYFKMDSMQGNYKSALENHILYKVYSDSDFNLSQRKMMDELTIKYAAEKKDKDISLLKQQGLSQQLELKQNKLIRNIMIAGTLLLLVTSCLLFSRYRLKQRTNSIIQKKNVILQQLVEEKEWLLKEVHHRVKNNLHTVISLLESQAAYLENDALSAIETSQHRIYAMSLIHQKLYQAVDVKTIDMSVYLPEFIRYLDESFVTNHNIQFPFHVEPISLAVSQAIPIALIINEAVTNSIKHAFAKNTRGVIEISMHKSGQLITLIIADNGSGIDEAAAKAATSSLGLKLIKGLTGDMNGTVTFSNDHGTSVTVIFNLDEFYHSNSIKTASENKLAIA